MKKEICPKCNWHNKAKGKRCGRCVVINEINTYSTQKLISVAFRNPRTIIPKVFHEDLIVYHEKNKNDFKDLFVSRYFHGKSGTGKTCRVYSIMLEILREGLFPNKKPKTCQLITVPDLLNELRKSIAAPKPKHWNNIHGVYKSPEQVMLDHFRNLDWLCLDDFGPEKTTDYASQMLYLIINHRYEHMMPTVITSNLTLDQLTAKLEDDRIPSRIMGMCSMIKVAGKDQRR